MKHALVLVALSLGLTGIVSDAAAVVGAPLTPVSYAGVARRTTRRVAAAETVAVTAPVAAATTVTVLPAGCADYARGGVVYQKCGATYYRPYYQGPNLVYVPATP